MKYLTRRSFAITDIFPARNTQHAGVVSDGHYHFVEVGPSQRGLRMLEALHRSRRRDAIRVLRRYRHLIAGQAQVRPAQPAPESRQTEKSSRNVHGNNTSLRAERKARRDAGNHLCDVTPLSLTALAIIAILVLVIHVASGETVGRSHANSSIAAPDDEATVPGGYEAAGAVAAVRLADLRGGKHMPDLATNLLLSVAVFAGAFVSGLAGFAFSAVAGAILLRIFQPMEAVPLMMACSIGVQAANLWALRRNIQWEGSLLLIVGGALGIPIAVYLLQNADTHLLRRWLRYHRRPLCRLHAVPADADAAASERPAGGSRR